MMTSPVQAWLVLVLARITTSRSLRIREKASTPPGYWEMPKWTPSPEIGRKYWRP